MTMVCLRPLATILLPGLLLAALLATDAAPLPCRVAAFAPLLGRAADSVPSSRQAADSLPVPGRAAAGMQQAVEISVYPGHPRLILGGWGG